MFDITEPIVQLLGVGLTVDGSASLTGESNVTSAAILVNLASSNLSAESDSSATITYVAVASASVTAESVLDSVAVLVAEAASSLSAESDLTAGIQQISTASSSLSADVSLSVTTNVVAVAAALANGGSNLTANGVRVQLATARIMPLEVVGTFTALVGHPVQGRPIVASSELSATIYTNPRLLVLPTVEYAYTTNVLLERYPIDNGRSLLITSGVGEIGDFFAQEQIRLADYYFGGGRRHELTAEQEAAVVAAGYGDLIVTEFL